MEDGIGEILNSLPPEQFVAFVPVAVRDKLREIAYENETSTEKVFVALVYYAFPLLSPELRDPDSLRVLAVLRRCSTVTDGGGSYE